MLKRSLGCLVLVLAGCSAVPQAPLPTLGLNRPEVGVTPAAEAASAVAGYGLATLGARELIVRFAPHARGRTPSQGAFVRRLRTGAELWVLDSEAALKAELELLWQDPEVLLAEPNVRVPQALTPDDPFFLGQWWHAKVGMPSAWDLPQGTGAASVVVAVVDSGVDMDHEDLLPNLAPGGYDFVDNDLDPNDEQGHGTHVAGIISAVAGNGLGGAGIAPTCKILPIRAGDASLFISDVADGVMHAVAQGAKIINLSLGSDADSPTMRAAVDQATLAGALVVAAAGNSNVTTPFYPAAYEGVLSVGATTSTDARAAFSNHGKWVKVAAPGVDILSTTFDGGYGLKSGTSMACPVVAGAAALVRSARPSLTAEQLERLLKAQGATVTGFTGNAALKRLNVPQTLGATTPVDQPPTLGVPTTSPSSTICAINVSASEPVYGSVSLSTNSTLTGATTLNLPTGSSRLAFSLSGLQANTRYYYRVNARDAAGGTAATGILSFLTSGPKINVFTAKAGLYAATLNWTTSTPTTRVVAIGPSATQLTTVVSMTGAHATRHELSLSDLVPGRTYYYRVTGTATDGGLLAPKTGSFKTTAFSARSTVSALTPTSATIGTQANAAADVTVRYGLSKGALTQVATGSGRASGHAVTLSGLRPALAYFFQVTAVDGRGNVSVSPVLTAKTMSLGIMELAAVGVTSSGATLQCHTTLPVMAELRLGLSPTSLLPAGGSTSPTTQLTAPLTGLSPNTTYYAQVVITDAASNTQPSSVISFTTLP